MSKESVADLGQEIQAKSSQLEAIFEEAKDENGVPDYSRVSSIEGDGQQVDSEVKRRLAEIDDLVGRHRASKERIEIAQKIAGISAEFNQPAAPLAQPQPAMLAKAEEYRNPLKVVVRDIVESGVFKSYGAGINPAVRMKLSLSDDELKTLFQTSAGWPLRPTRTGRVEFDPQRPISVAEFLPVIPTTQSSVISMEETTFTNNAAEAAAGAAYGESALALTQRTQAVEKVAVTIPFTDEQVEDEPQALAYLEQRLEYMLRARIDLQIIRGNGSTPNLLGTNSVSGIQTQAKSTDTGPDAVHKLLTKIRGTAGFTEPNVAFFHPADWQDIRLLRTADGIYIFGNPTEVGPETIWGVPVVQTTAATENTVTIGDYAGYSALHIKRDVDVRITDSDSTDFVSGKQKMRLDLRLAVVHYRPEAFGTVTSM